MDKDKPTDGYKQLSPKGKQVVEMYITARQFKNAVLEEEMIILPTKILNAKEGTTLQWGSTKITLRGEKSIVRIYPFIVNKAFACEVYLKLILAEDDFDFKSLKIHNILKLFKNTSEKFKRYFYEFFQTEYGEKADETFLKSEITKISNVFQEWRYIYERTNEENLVNYGFLNAFCDFLDKYSQQLISEQYSYDVSKNMR